MGDTPIAKTLCDARVKVLEEIDAQGLIPRHELKVFVRMPASERLLKRQGIFSSPKKFLPMAEERLLVEYRRPSN